MKQPAAASAAWSELRGLASPDASGRRLLESALERARQAVGARGAALYRSDGPELVLEAAAAESPFPARLDDERAAAYRRLALDGGEILFERPATEVGEPSDALLTLAAAVRAWMLEKRLKRERFEVAFRGVELESLYDVGLAIASTLELEQLSEEVLLRAISLLDARRGALYLVSGDGYALNRSFGGEARERVAFEDPQVGGLLRGQASEDTGLLPGARHLLAVPIEVEGKPLGLLVVGDKESRHGVGPFRSSDRRTLGLFANQAAIALENAHLHRQALEKERLEREAELAAEIQRRLLPVRLPAIDGLDLAGWSRPARQVGGDYYDLLKRGENRLTAVVADVAGKGIPAALMVSNLYSALRLLIDGSSVGPDLARRLNHHICASSAPNKFITLVAAEVDGPSGEMRYLNAGHNPALLLSRDGGLRELEPGGLPLGILPGSGYRSGSLRMAPGDLLCFFSDGITESASPEDEEFGVGRLVDLLRETAGLALGDIVRRIEGEVSRFARGMPQADDQTLVLLRKR